MNSDDRMQLVHENQTWLRRLARQLLRDSNDVDDVVQSTLTIAMTKSPENPRSIRGWLRTVLVNEVRGRHRGDRRRGHRERAAARSEVTTDADLVERVELQRRVTDAVLALEEPFREILLRHYVEERSPVEIAKLLGVPRATVRTRLHRAHVKLREALDDDLGSRDGARAGLLLLATSPAVGAAAAAVAAATATTLTVGGVVVMAKKLAIAGVVLSLVGWAGMVAFDHFGRVRLASGPGVDSERDGSDLQVRSHRSSSSPASSTEGRIRLTEEDGRSTESSTTETEIDESQSLMGGSVAIVKGRVLSDDGRSFEGARIFLGPETPGAVIDGNNEFRFEAVSDATETLFLEVDGARVALDATVRPIFGEEAVVEVWVEAGHTVEIYTVEAGSGRAVARAPITLKRVGPSRQAKPVLSESDSNGRARIAHLPAGDYELAVNDPDYAYTRSSFRVPTDRVEVVLEPARSMEVVLRGYGDDLSVESVSLKFLHNDESNDQTWTGGVIESGVPDSNGSFRIRAPHHGKWRYSFFWNWRYAHVRGTVRVPKDGPIEPLVIDLVVRPTMLLRGSLRRPDGLAVSHGTVGFYRPRDDSDEWWFGEREVPVQSDGTFELDRFPREGGAALRWRDDAGQQEPTITFELGTLDVPDRELWTTELQVPGTQELIVRLEHENESTQRRALTVLVYEDDPFRPVARSAGGAHKAVRFPYLPPGEYKILSRLGIDVPPLDIHDVTIEEGSAPVEISLACPPLRVVHLHFRDGAFENASFGAFMSHNVKGYFSGGLFVENGVGEVELPCGFDDRVRIQYSKPDEAFLNLYPHIRVPAEPSDEPLVIEIVPEAASTR